MDSEVSNNKQKSVPSKKSGPRGIVAPKEFYTDEELLTPQKNEPKKRGRKAKAKEKEKEDKQQLI